MKWKDIEEGAIISHEIEKSPQTGGWRYMEPQVNKDTCIGCEQCVSFCPEACIELDAQKKAEIDHNFCKGCGVCAQVCPKKAINMKRKTFGG